MVTVLLLVWTHFIGDFVFQTDEVVRAKGRSNWALVSHTFTYIATFSLLGWVIPITTDWIILNMALHGVTDYVTSRAKTRLWREDETHLFFVVVGFDQAIHISTLLLTYQWMFGKIVF
jgi:hypothetical protein